MTHDRSISTGSGTQQGDFGMNLPTNSDLDLDRLRVLATAAADGPWEVFSAEDIIVIRVETQDCVCSVGQEDDSDIDDVRADAAYIAAISPDVLLALLSRLQASEARVRELETAWRPFETLPAPVNEAAHRRVHVYMPDVVGEKVQTMTIGNVARMTARITHWMPLPDAPALPAPPAEEDRT